eukprot:g10770.t1
MDHAPAHASEEEQKNQNLRFIEGEHKMGDHGAQECLPRDLDVDRSKFYAAQTRKNSSILSRSGTPGLGRQLFYYGEEEAKVPFSSTSAHDGHDSANKPRTTHEQFLSRLADLYSLQTNQKLNRECQRLLEYRALGKINRVIFWDWIVLVGALWMMLYFYVEGSCVGSTPFADLPGNLEAQASSKELGGDVQSGLNSVSAASASSDSSTVVTPTSNSNMIQGFFPPSESASRHKIADGLAGKNTLWQTLYVAWSGYTNCGLHLWGTAMYVWNEDVFVLLVLSLLVLVGNSMFPMVLRYSLTLGRWWNSRKRGYNFYDSTGTRSASGVISVRESEDPLAALDAEIEKMILARTRTTKIDTIFQNDQRAEQHRERVSDSVSKAEPGAPPDTVTTEKKPKIRMFGKRPTTPGPELANKDDAKMILIDPFVPTSSLTVQQRVQRLIAAVRSKISDPQQQAGFLLALAFFAHCGLDSANTNYATTKVDSVNARKLVDLIATRNKVLVAMRKAKEDLEMKKFIATAVSFRRSGAVEDEERAPDHHQDEQNQDPFQAPGSEQRESDNILHVDIHSLDFATYEFALKHPRRCCTHLFPQIHTKWLLLFSVTLNLVMFLCMAWQDWDGEVWAYLYDLHDKEVDNRSDVDGSNYANPAEAAAVFASTTEAYFVALLKLLNMLLQSHSTRTTGWSCLNVDGFSLPTLFLFLICMYISTSPTVVAMRYSALLPSSRSLGALSGEDGGLDEGEHELEGLESGSTPLEAIEMVEQVVDERLPSEERERPIEQVGGDDVEKKGDAAKVVLVKKDDESATGKDALSVASQGSKPDSLAAEMADVDAELALAEAAKTAELNNEEEQEQNKQETPAPPPPQRVSLFGGLVQSFASSLGYYSTEGAGVAELATKAKPVEAAAELRNGSKRSFTSTPSNKATRANGAASKIPSKSASEETLECVDITGQTAAEDAGAAGEAVLGEGGDDGGSGGGKTTLRGQIRNYMLQHSVFLVVAVFFVLCFEKAELARRDAEAEQVVVEIGSGPGRGSASALVETDSDDTLSVRRGGVNDDIIDYDSASSD